MGGPFFVGRGRTASTIFGVEIVRHGCVAIGGRKNWLGDVILH